MFTYFNKNKLRYEKGQLAAFFIALLVILIIMALVTVNLSKVSFIKTDAGNAVDAGALAGGSVMANVFNAVASANSQMIVAYEEFIATVGISFAIAFTSLGFASKFAGEAFGFASAAVDKACPAPCAAKVTAEAAAASAGKAVTALGYFQKTTWGIIIAVTSYHLAQFYFYKIIRKAADEGRVTAIDLAHKFLFMNSGIGSKLKSGNPPAGVSGEQANGYRNKFSSFLDGIEDSGAAVLTYSWLDGQSRQHFVRSTVGIDELDDYDLRVTLLPLAAELALLDYALETAYSAQGSMITAAASYGAAVGLLEAACDCKITFFFCDACCKPSNPSCCTCAALAFICWEATCGAAETALDTGITANEVAIGLLPGIAKAMGSALAGLAPALTVPNNLVDSAVTFIICWIDDIDHNRLVRVDSIQHHQGIDLGIWETRYPDTAGNITSYSVVNFTGRGQIYEPELRHDASIVETDNRNVLYNPCPRIVANTLKLEEEADLAIASAVDLEARALELETEAKKLPHPRELLKAASDLRIQAASSRDEAGRKEEEAAENRSSHAECFP